MIIDCHGHFTTEPPAFHAFRRSQVDYLEGRGSTPEPFEGIPDDELREIIEANQLRLQRERGTDLTILSPRAAGMSHHYTDQQIANDWARLSNDTIARIVELFPGRFAGVCQLPQTPRGDLRPVIAELERCIGAGFVGCNLNPDPTGGSWSGPALDDPYWEPLWDRLEELDSPAMLHVSASHQPAVHTTGAHYLAADTIVFMQLLQGDLFERHPNLRLIIPHGGGAVPYHWGRYRGLAAALGRPPLSEHLMRNVFFDTCVYHQPGIDLLFDVIDADNLLFGSELLGAVKTTDPETGQPFDDTKQYIDALALDDAAKRAVFEGNARRVYPRLDARLTAQGR
ncbi:amidohydrolase [Microbacterium sp. HD4P20]|uniref:amidohydrolase family protein n=1 Tax=Microbacterium sp. HD4P20 TaxID=2864874 RepID=UPI001C6401A7|nr:amidohydrolase family protein [Microbacterium sp. HD4P20]MCP2636051.1 amidohydrolase [Microbacterium sp. HD4P20]